MKRNKHSKSYKIILKKIACNGIIREEKGEASMPIQDERIDPQLLEAAQEILEEIGLDVTTAVTIMLKRITKEGGISFMLPDGMTGRKAPVSGEPQSRMTKNRAIALFRKNGYALFGTTTFASKNQSAHHYWANPGFDVLNGDWNLILNDWNRRTLYLFAVPARELSADMLVARADKAYQIDLQIMYEDSSFTDMRSKVSFARYLVTSLAY